MSEAGMQMRKVLLLMFILLVFAACAGPEARQPTGPDLAAREASLAADVPLTQPLAGTAEDPRTHMAATPVPATATASATATPLPSPTPPPTLVPTPAVQPVSPFVTLEGFTHMWQTWNNCGPATVAMNLSYYGSDVGQAQVGAVLRPNSEDKNTSPVEMAQFARQQGLRALVRVNGKPERLQALLSNGIPVIIETWLEPEDSGGLGHYRLLIGYDDAQQRWTGYDTYYRDRLVNPTGPYAGIYMPYAETEALWRVFNRTYIVIYQPEQAPLVEAILGTDMDDERMWQQALAKTQTELDAQPSDAFGWFNLGTGLTALGRYAEAAEAYDQARALGLPRRMHWYQFGPFQAYYSAGRYQDVIALADATLRPAVQIEEVQYWKAQALSALGNEAAAEPIRQQIQVLNKNFDPRNAYLTIETAAPAPAQAAPTAPAAIPGAEPLIHAEFIADVTLPDGSLVQPGQALTKVWRVQNSGNQPWEGYVLRSVPGDGSATDRLDGPAELPLAATAPGASLDISLELTAPPAAGSYTGLWQIVAADGTPVPGGQVWLIVTVSPEHP